MTPTKYRLDETFEYGHAAVAFQRSLALRRAVDAGRWAPAAPPAPRPRTAAVEHIVASKQLQTRRPATSTTRRRPHDDSGSNAADDATLASSVTRSSRQSCRPMTSPVQTWRRCDRAPPASALAPRWAAEEMSAARAATTGGAGRPKGGTAADDDIPVSLAYLPARLPTDRFFDAASRLEDATSPYYWTGSLHRPAARCFLAPTILHAGRSHALRRTMIKAARARGY